MKFKMIMLISLIMVILSVGVISAADFDDIWGVNSDIDISLKSVDVENIDNVCVDELQNNNGVTGTFDDLQVEINNAPANSTLDLNMDYKGHYGSRIQLNKDLTIDGHGHTLNCLDEGGCSAFYSSSGTITLKNLKIINGHNDYIDKGGAIYASGTAQYILKNCIFADNWADDYGGAIYNEGNKPLIIEDCIFTFNKADDENGGAIYSKSEVYVSNSTFDSNKAYVGGGAVYSEKNVYADNCLFKNNEAYGALIATCYGGAVYADGDVTVNNCTFTGNRAENYGGAIYAKKRVYINNNQDVTDYNSFFINNHALKKDGGAVYGCEDVYAKNTEFSKNTALGSSGAVYGSKVNVIHCLLDSNSVQDLGGAIGLLSGSVYTDNSIFRNNTARHEGGAIFGKWVTINNSTFENNLAYRNGGGVYVVYLTINDAPSYFINNTAFEKGGGAIFTSFFSKGTVKYATFKENHAGISEYSSLDGGAVYIYDKTTVTFSQCVFINNFASDEGGAVYADSRNDYVNLLNNIFIGNNADEGKSVYNCGKFGTIKNNYWSTTPTKDNDQLIEWEPLFVPNVHHVDSDPLKYALILDKSSCHVNGTVKATFCFLKSDGSIFAGEMFDTGLVSFDCDSDVCFENQKADKNSASIDLIPKMDGTHVITAKLYGLSISKSLDVYDLNVVAPEVTTFFNVPATFKVKLTGNKNLTAYQKVIISCLFHDYEAYTDENGETIFNLNNVASSGRFIITVKVLDLTFDSAVNVISTINANDVVMGDGNNTPFYARFTDNNGQYLPINSVVGFSFDNSDMGYSQIKDNEGLASFNIRFLTPGIHYLTLFNLQTNEVMTYEINIGGSSQLSNGINQNNSSVNDNLNVGSSSDINSSNDNSLDDSFNDNLNVGSSSDITSLNDNFHDYSVNDVSRVVESNLNVNIHSHNNSVAKSASIPQSASGNNNILVLLLLILVIIGFSGLVFHVKNK